MTNPVKFTLPKNSIKGEANFRDFSWEVDEPENDGGTDLAPTPMDYAYGALASCIAITLRLYAERKEWETGEIHVEVYAEKNEHHQKELHKKITFTNHQLTEEQMERLYDISSKCPVSKLFLQATPVVLDK